MKLNGTMLSTEDPQKLAEFYTKLLGKPDWEEDGWTGFTSGSNLMIGPHSEVKGESKSPARIMMMFETNEIEAEYSRIKAIGAEIIAKLYHPNPEDENMRMATFADPDGNYFQIATPWQG